MQNLQYVMKNKINPMANDEEWEGSNAFDIHKPMKAYLTKWWLNDWKNSSQI